MKLRKFGSIVSTRFHDLLKIAAGPTPLQLPRASQKNSAGPRIYLSAKICSIPGGAQSITKTPFGQGRRCDHGAKAEASSRKTVLQASNGVDSTQPSAAHTRLGLRRLNHGHGRHGAPGPSKHARGALRISATQGRSGRRIPAAARSRRRHQRGHGRDWVTNVRTTRHYLSAPFSAAILYPTMVRDFPNVVIGREAAETNSLRQKRLPDAPFFGSAVRRRFEFKSASFTISFAG